MLSLRELQVQFAALLVAADGAEGINNLDRSAINKLATVIAPGPISADPNSQGPLTAGQRIQIYRNNFHISLRGALAAVYPVVRALVGEGFFAYLAHEFVGQHPSRSGNLHSFGQELPDFLRSFEAAASLPYLPDVAIVEWAWHRAFHAAECSPLDLAALAAVPVEEHSTLKFGLHPSVSLFRSAYPVVAIWEAHQDDRVTPVDMASGGCVGIVQRPMGQVRVVTLTPEQFALLDALRRGKGLGEACDNTAHAHPDGDVAGAFQQLVALGSLASFTVSADTV